MWYHERRLNGYLRNISPFIERKDWKIVFPAYCWILPSDCVSCLLLDLAFEVLNYCSQNGVLETRGDADKDEVGGLERIAISPSLPYLLYTIFRSWNDGPLPDIFSTMFFLRYCGWWRLSLNDCIKRWRWSRYVTSLPAWAALTTPKFPIIVFKESSSHDSKIIFRSASTSSSASCASKDLANKKLYSADWLGFGNVPSEFWKHGSFFSDECFEQRKRISKTNVHLL